MSARRRACSRSSAWPTRRERSCGELAYGDLKRLELAIALANDPKLLLMDEPAAGMAPSERHALMDLTARLARERTIGVLFTEHDMDVVFGHADRVLVLNRGDADRRGRAVARCAPARRSRQSISAPARSIGAEPLTARSAKLAVSGLNAAYGQARVLFDVALNVAAGEAVALHRAQRRRQIDDVSRYSRAHSRIAAARSSSTARTSRRWRPTTSYGAVSAMFRRTGASSPT